MHALVLLKNATRLKLCPSIRGLQICCFFALIVSTSSISAQTDIFQTEVNFWFSGAKACEDDTKLEAAALISFRLQKPTHRVGFLAKGLEVRSIVRMESPIKSKLIIRPKGDSLIVRSSQPLQPNKTYRWLINYKIDLTSNRYANYVMHNESLVAFNFFNIGKNGNNGSPGMFFPSLKRDKFKLSLNLSVVPNKSISSNGELTYKVEVNDGSEAQFWDGDKLISAEAFYLVMGTFKDAVEEELEEELILADISLRKIKIAQSKEWLYPTLDFYEMDYTQLTDSEYVLVDSLSELRHAPFFANANELGIDTNTYALEQALLLYTFKGDTVKASNLQWKKYSESRSLEWQETVLNEKWKRWDSIAHWQKASVLDFKLQQWVLQNEYLFSEQDLVQLDTMLFKPMLQSLRFPKLKLSYRYVGGDTAMYISYEQDTTVAPVYWLPAQIKLYAKNGEVFYRNILFNQAQGKVKVNYPFAPSYADVEFGKGFLGSYQQTKPDVYSIYLLNNGKTIDEKKQALRALMTTNNVNLKATILDIALSHQDAEIVDLALNNVSGLSPQGYKKLETVLGDLSLKAKDEELRRKAELLLLKYYK